MGTYRSACTLTSDLSKAVSDTEERSSSIEGETHLDALHTRVTHIAKLRDYAIAIVITIAAAFFLKTFVIEAYRIPTASMENTLLVGDYLLVNKFVYGATTPRRLPFSHAELPFIQLPRVRMPERGDIIVFEFHNKGESEPFNATEPVNFVKRCVAVGGDTVQFVDSKLYVNGMPFPEIETMPSFYSGKLPNGYCDERMWPPGECFNREYYGPVVVPRTGEVDSLNLENIVMWQSLIRHEGHNVSIGQNRSIMIDGKPASTYTVEENYVFVVGDNRDNSLDSRYWGFVPERKIVGEAMMIYWSWDQEHSLWPITEKLASIRWNRIGRLVH